MEKQAVDGFWLIPFMIFSFLSSIHGQNSDVISINAANTSVFKDENTGFKFVKFVTELNKFFMADKPLQIQQVKTYKDCLMSCVASNERECVATNIAKSANSRGLYNCWLLQRDIFKIMNKLMNNVSYDFYAVKTKCLLSPCQHKGSCDPVFSTNTYRCNCTSCFYGDNCEKAVKTEPFGMEDGRIADSAITASSYLRDGLAPWQGRLRTSLGWAPYHAKAGEYLQIDLGYKVRIAAVATQGRRPGDSYNQFIKTYTLAYSDNGVQFTYYSSNGAIKVFQGNVDRDSVVTNVLPTAIFARYLRIVIQTANLHPVMRAEVYKCDV